MRIDLLEWQQKFPWNVAHSSIVLVASSFHQAAMIHMFVLVKIALYKLFFFTIRKPTDCLQKKQKTTFIKSLNLILTTASPNSSTVNVTDERLAFLTHWNAKLPCSTFTIWNIDLVNIAFNIAWHIVWLLYKGYLCTNSNSQNARLIFHYIIFLFEIGTTLSENTIALLEYTLA